MFNSSYYRTGDVTHRTEVKAAPPGESIRFADDIRKELLDKADKAFMERISFEFDSPELGKIKFIVAEQLDYIRNERMVYFKLNESEHRMTFDPFQYQTRQAMIEGFFKVLSENIAAKLLVAFSRTDKARLFGDMK